ncbi:hypothetical protein N9852_04990 [Alphaproteobacteria bacterium]|nr:hypothetical protein [Alphaproteobacteria bacterium]
MKKLLIILLLVPSLSWGSMKTLNEILTIRDMSDPASVIYVAQRCAGLYAAGWDHIVDQNPTLAEDLLYGSQLLTYKASQLYKAPNLSSDEKLKEMIVASQNFQKIYTDIFTENWISNGAYFEGTWVENDLTVCSEVLNIFSN